MWWWTWRWIWRLHFTKRDTAELKGELDHSAPIFSGMSWERAALFSEDWIQLHYKVRLFIFLGKTPAVCISWGNLSKITDPKRTIKSGLGQTVPAGVRHSHLEGGRWIGTLREWPVCSGSPTSSALPKMWGVGSWLEMLSLGSSAPSQSKTRVLGAEPLSSSVTLGIRGTVTAAPLPLAK